ncbi:unnamed protein product [Meloidogyne enterolobii]|uniref:Uncharacterized protein n=1 Tax=Meloidogyne enterolobii TaxID=390850 RepID=A0ACB0XXA0_MELEN
MTHTVPPPPQGLFFFFSFEDKKDGRSVELSPLPGLELPPSFLINCLLILSRNI